MMTKKHTEINYIGPISAEWVDPAVELPPEGWRGLAINSDGDVVYATAHVPRVLLGCLAAWLRIGGPSDAIPREAVQAAVDEMTVRYWEGAECILHEVGERDHCEGCAFDQYPLPLCKSLACIAHHTGVTPSEVL